ncbi:MFS family permease [Rhizobium leguminosarum]|uniref:MFS family permease n=1 Tax=Rhizobium leguminosarum TaxID=384 RepID=A0A7Z0IXT8_RHILE|nr:MFS family permease [Rhizobium leguminosarum]
MSWSTRPLKPITRHSTDRACGRPSSFGPSQVASRLINMTFGKRLAALHLAVIAAVLIPAGVLILLLMSPSTLGAMAFAVVFGMGNGLLSIVTGTLPLHLFGSAGYGQLQGNMMAARLILSALAPFALALSIARLGIAASLVICAVLGISAVVTLLRILPLVRSNTPTSSSSQKPSGREVLDPLENSL